MSLAAARCHIQFGNDLPVDILGKGHIVNMCIPSEMLGEVLISFSGGVEGISGKVSHVKLSVSLPMMPEDAVSGQLRGIK